MAEEKPNPINNPVEMVPGQVISPAGTPAAQPTKVEAQQAQPEQPQVPPAPEGPTQTFSFNGGVETASSEPQTTGESVNWVASEFILHEKSAGWYLVLAFVALAISGVIYLITKDPISCGVILFGALMFGVYASRKPRQLPYQVDSHGVQIGQRSFSYGDFRTFSVVQEGAFSSIVFTPLKRFAPLTSIYYPPEQEEKIVSIVANNLPMEERSQDPIDKLMHKVGF